MEENRVEEGLVTLKEYLANKQYMKLREWVADLNYADVAAMIENFEEEDEMLRLFRILPKDLAADIFSYLPMEIQQKIITSLSDKDAGRIIGRRGRTIKAIRTLARALGSRVGTAVEVEVLG